MIHFREDWTIHIPPGESLIARQHDNLTRSIVVTGVPDGWDWTLLVQASGKLDIIALEPVEGGVGVALTAQMLALSGFHSIQLRGTQGDLVRHTNVAQAIIPASLSGDATWPTVPSAVEQVLQQMEELNAHPPYPGDGGYWMIWDLDTHAYVESQLPLPAGGGGGTGDYNALDNLPSINGVTIKGALSVADLGIPDLSASVEAAQGAAQAAAEGARAAQGAAQSAEERAQDAQTAKGFAEEAKSEAEISAQQAQKSAAQADESAAAAQGHANTAQGAVTAAQASAEKAATSAEEAKGVVPPADGVPQNYVLTPAGWAEPSGSGGQDKQWKLFQEITGDGDTLSWEWTDLDFTEFLFVGVGLTNQSENTTSSVRISINAKEVAYLSTQKSVGASATKHQRLRLKYSGYFWDSVLIPQSNNETGYYTTYGTASCPYSVELGAQKCSTLKLSTPISTYRLISGTIRIYAR